MHLIYRDPFVHEENSIFIFDRFQDGSSPKTCRQMKYSPQVSPAFSTNVSGDLLLKHPKIASDSIDVERLYIKICSNSIRSSERAKTKAKLVIKLLVVREEFYIFNFPKLVEKILNHLFSPDLPLVFNSS